MSINIRLVSLAFLLGATLVGIAQAEEQGASDGRPSVHARKLGHSGLKLFSEGKFAQARLAFSEANDIAHSPVFVLYQARSERELGHLLSARSLYQSCAQEGVTAETPAAWKKAIAEATQELNELRREIPTVLVQVSGDVWFPLSIESNHQTLTMDEPEALYEMDPGAHALVAQDAKGTVIVLQLFLRPGEKNVHLRFAFPRVRQSVHERPLRPVAHDQYGGSQASLRPYRSGAHAAFLVGGSALIFTAVAGSVAWSKVYDVKKHCVESSCRAQDEQKAMAARRWANLATVGFATGVTGLGLGMGLLFYPVKSGGQVAITGAF